jgi:hypothetical protein
VHVLAGWLIPSEQRTDFATAIMRAKQRNPQALELKGKDLLKTPRGRKTARIVIHEALSAGGLPIFVIAEKRYCIAAKVVETFLDPFHNPGAYWLPTGANIDRQSIADVFYGSPDDLIHEFAAAYREPSRESFERVIRSFAEYANQMGRIDLSSSLLAQIDSLDDLVSTELADGPPLKRNKLTGLNVTVFLSLMVLANGVVRHCDDTLIDVVHDEAFEFEEAFRMVFEGWRRGNETVLPFVLQDGSVAPSFIECMDHFRLGKSVCEPEIQAADVLSSSLRWLAERVSLGKEDEYDKELAALALVPLLPGAPLIHAKAIGSTNWVRKLLRPLFDDKT